MRHVPRRYYDQHPFRVWSDGTVQDTEEDPHRWMSDDFVIAWAYNEAEALVLASGAEPTTQPADGAAVER